MSGGKAGKMAGEEEEGGDLKGGLRSGLLVFDISITPCVSRMNVIHRGEGHGADRLVRAQVSNSRPHNSHRQCVTNTEPPWVRGADRFGMTFVTRLHQ